MGSQHKPQNSSTILLDWTGFRPQHRKPRVQRPPTPCTVPGHPLELLSWSFICGRESPTQQPRRGEFKGLELSHLASRLWDVQMEKPLGLWASQGQSGPLYLRGNSPTSLPYLRAASRESTGWQMRKDKTSIKFMTKTSFATLFWTSRAMVGARMAVVFSAVWKKWKQHKIGNQRNWILFLALFLNFVSGHVSLDWVFNFYGPQFSHLDL